MIGIDLRTTFSRAGVFKNGKVEIISNDRGVSILIEIVANNLLPQNRATPSCVEFADNGKRSVGTPPRTRQSSTPRIISLM
mmetsp:Transcript_8432/g.13615  ORF Transcript_8432/g.13615 Transcript_8432/m.13615 type:complete len:81 (-) Transcript_8432:392-634(-)